MTPGSEALRKAADHIDEHPECYLFFVNDIPRRQDTQACAIGWVAYFAGLKDIEAKHCTALGAVTRKLFGMSEIEFYREMLMVKWDVDDHGQERWHRDAAACAEALRLLAMKEDQLSLL